MESARRRGDGRWSAGMWVLLVIPLVVVLGIVSGSRLTRDRGDPIDAAVKERQARWESERELGRIAEQKDHPAEAEAHYRKALDAAQLLSGRDV